MLPKGWQRRSLGDVAQISSGGTPDRAKAEYWGGTIPWVTTGEIQFNTITDTAEKITELGLKKSSAKLFPIGTLLMAMYGQGKTRGQVAKLGIEATTNQNSAAILLSDTCDPDFFFYYFSWKYQSIREFGQAGGISHLNAGLLKIIPVPVAPFLEQRCIARVLATWDKAITTTERLLINSREQTRALQARILMLRIPRSSTERNGNTFPPSVQAGIPVLPATPSGWQRINLGKHLWEARRPIVLEPESTYTLVTVKRSRGGAQKRERLRGADIKTPTQFIVRAGDFLISKRQIVHGACGIVPPELDGAVVSNEYAVLSSDGEIDLQFLRYLSESVYFQQTCFHSSIGIHVEKMIFRTERWLSWPFNIPPLEEQRRIVKVLDTAATEIVCIERQLKALVSEKTALMAQLLTGKRRVNAGKSKEVLPA